MSTTDKAFVRAFPPCNSTTLCDNWKLRPATVNSATKYCGAELVEEKKKGTKGTK